MTISRNLQKIQVIMEPSNKRSQEDLYMSVTNINKNNFQNEVLNSEKPVLLDLSLIHI